MSRELLLAHELVHSYPLMPEGKSAENSWYLEGVAEFYSVVLLYRYGLWARTNL
jgi:hypothetical protein